MTTPPRPRKNPSSAANHRRNSPKSSEKPTPITKTISKTPETHRVFTEIEEIQLLKTLLESPNNSEFTSNGNFTETQIAKKLKRLKEKYHKLARSKSLIKTPHDQKIYEIARQIWGRNAAKGKEPVVELNRSCEEEKGVEEEVNLEEFPFLVSEMMSIFGRNEYCKEGLRRLGKEKLKRMNEKWMELRLKEAEVMVNKAKLYHQYLKLVVEDSKGTDNEMN
ncbi:probable transcription factor At1g44810 [Nicotiana tomentosiformis]|uniref:probable transcription factor At1g44810 n=1 Tax=Nicotiana tomentosiformis TaxID=4098 RepID=UPI00051B5907|nr:probable transcription factor At1g61730 [Nicotiana tomentosiformis]